ncbi:MAG: AmmeMemoRadiSam system protein B, partial [Nitrospinota bacterium]|nr:AmmeMemoRadiSam system protein B [Nitrospinota bacterium]
AVMEDGVQMVMLSANDGLTESAAVVSLPAFYLITLMDGNSSLGQIGDKFYDQFHVKVPEKEIDNLVAKLDEALLLDNEKYRAHWEASLMEFNASPTRLPAHAGKSYPADPKELAELMARITDAQPAGHGEAESVIVPHIDFRVGASMMAQGWREIPSGTDDLIIILGTGHYLANDFFSCIDKDFDTPLGRMKVDRDFLSSLARNFGEDLFQNPAAHKGEHSIEFQALFMASRAKTSPGQKCVPILLSFPENIFDIDHPVFNGPRLDRFITALAKTAAGYGKKVRYVASVDLAHIGARFGDEEPLTTARLKQVEQEDMELVDTFTKLDTKGFLERITRINQKNRVCGFPALYLLSRLTKAGHGKMLSYRQNVEGEMENMVSFTTMALYE